MSAMDDAFGRIGPRPDTPTFWKLSEIVLRSDGALEAAETSEDKQLEWQRLMHEVIDDLDAVSYVALQRAMRLTNNAAELASLASLWLDAFSAGAHYVKEGGSHG